MKNIIFVAGITLSLCLPFQAFGATPPLAQKLKGRILLQVESYGRAWYVNPVDGTRFYLKDGQAAYEVMRQLSLGITNVDLEKIPTTPRVQQKKSLAVRLAGRIVLQVQSHGEAWYINPVSRTRYYLKDGAAAYALMRTLGLGIKDADLKTIPVNPEQIVYDPTFDDSAYILLRGDKVITEKYQNQILPLASMSKLMTALVLLDQPNFNQNAEITITQTAIDYPTTIVGDDTTSEVGLRPGDILTAHDLWVAMLVASSNQATIALVDSAGLERSTFVAAMNAKAKTLGLTRTQFFDPTGLDAHNVITAYEMALLAKVAFNRPEITTAAQQNDYTIFTRQVPSRAIKVAGYNYSLQRYNVEVAKVGYLIEAKVCIALKKGEDIIVVMHVPHLADRNKVLDILTSL